jgi:tripartite-type tricarboxylate transporter receptor subunit TctC
VRELIAYAKANPGKLNFAGAGGFTQFAGEIFKHTAGVDMVHVPYRGGAPAVAAAAAGDVQLTFANFSDALTWMRSGRLRPIALTSAKRFPQAPDVPTIAESGLPGYEVNGWSGLLAPAGTPPAIVDRIARVLQKDFAEPAMRKRWEDIGAEPGHADPAAFAAMIRADMQKWSEFVKRTGIKVE